MIDNTEAIVIVAVLFTLLGATLALFIQSIYRSRFPKHISVCAWCRCLYNQNGKQISKALIATEYNQFTSHGICKPCSEKQLRKPERRAGR